MKSPPADRADGSYGPHGGIGATFFTGPSRRVHGAFAGLARLSCPAHTVVLSFKHLSHILRIPCSKSSPTP